MKDAEKVTFGGSAFDRAAHMRGDSESLVRMANDPGARAVLLWRGKPALFWGDDDGQEHLALVQMTHPALREGGLQMFLGLEDAAPRFAVDLAGWTPDTLPESLGAFADPSEQVHPDLPPGTRFAELRARMVHLSARDAELAAMARGLSEWHRIHGFCARCGFPTVPSKGGWQRRCPDCGAPHFPRTDPVVIMLVTHGNAVLLGRAPGWPARMYSLLAGFVEPGETVEAAVRRETCEETGIHVGGVEYLASQPWAFPASLMIGCRAEATTTDLRLDPVEIEDAIWLSREETMRALAGDHPDVAPARRGAIAHFLLSRWVADRLD